MTFWFFEIHNPKQILYPSPFTEKGSLKTNLDQL